MKLNNTIWAAHNARGIDKIQWEDFMHIAVSGRLLVYSIITQKRRLLKYFDTKVLIIETIIVV